MPPNDPYRRAEPQMGPALVDLPVTTGSLARYVPVDMPAGTLCVLGEHGGVQVGPATGRTVRIGRNVGEVDVPVGPHDDAVSRVQATVTFDGRCWRLTNVGVLPIRLPGSEMLLAGQDEPLPRAYTPVFIKGLGGREYVLELRVTRSVVSSSHRATRPARCTTTTRIPDGWLLNDVERLVLISLAQRYLRRDSGPQPQPWAAVVAELSEVRPDVRWTEKMVQERVRRVRERLGQAGVPGLLGRDVAPPLGNTLNHNLIVALLEAAVLTPRDLSVLDDAGESGQWRAEGP